MGKINRESLGYLGLDFQLRLVAQLLTDKKFANNIIDIINPNYFDDEYIKVITATIKDAYEQDETIPDVGSLEFRLLENIKDDIKRTSVLSQLRKIKEANLNDTFYVQQTAMKFCKLQELKKSVKEINKILEKGDLEEFPKCEEILKKALEHGDNSDDDTNVCDDIDAVLADDFRKPIPTGISKLDEIMDGGLARGELGVILAPYGAGKSTILTKFANTAKNNHNNVLQIIFEDMPKVIKRKHLACWSGIELNNLKLHKETLLAINAEKESEDGKLLIKKFPSHGTTIPQIRQYIRKKIAQGFRPDMVLIDYIDCVVPSKKYDDVNVGEGSVMREAESLASEFDFALWTAIQGNRSSLTAEIVEANQMGGSIKKGQIGHFILSIARTLTQKDSNLATLAVLKSRFGKDGLVFQDVIFNNGTVYIEITNNNGSRTFLETKNDKIDKNQERTKQVLEQAEKRQKYNEIIKKADKVFDEKDYEEAQELYESALLIKSDEVKPKNRLIEIEKLMNEEID